MTRTPRKGSLIRMKGRLGNVVAVTAAADLDSRTVRRYTIRWFDDGTRSVHYASSFEVIR